MRASDVPHPKTVRLLCLLMFTYSTEMEKSNSTNSMKIAQSDSSAPQWVCLRSRKDSAMLTPELNVSQSVSLGACIHNAVNRYLLEEQQ